MSTEQTSYTPQSPQLEQQETITEAENSNIPDPSNICTSATPTRSVTKAYNAQNDGLHEAYAGESPIAEYVKLLQSLPMTSLMRYGSIIFVHGLNGDCSETWSGSTTSTFCFPRYPPITFIKLSP